MTPAPGLGFSRDENTVTLRMTIEDWESLLLLLGFSTGRQLSQGAQSAVTGFEDSQFRAALALMNRINAGNPNWWPYAEDARQGAP